jgi:hypothetical protein
VIFRKKKPTTPTLEDQAATASLDAAMYVGAFTVAAEGLERVANDLDAVRDAAAAEASRHLALKVEADTAAFQHRSQAQKIRDLLL